MAKDYGVNAVFNGIDKLTPMMGNLSKEFLKQIGIITVAATAVKVVFGGLKIAADFEAQMDSVEAVAGATAAEMNALRQMAIDLGADTAFSASEAARGMEELAKAGLTPGQVLESIGPMLSLAAAGGLDLASAAGIAAAALNTFNLPAAEAGRVADVLAQTANMSTTSVQGVGEAMKYAGGPSAALGLSIEDTAAAIGLMANRGIDASMAGTTLNAALMALVNPSDKAAEVLKQLGIQTTDAKGRFLPFKDILAQFPPELLETQAGMAAINTIFGERGQRGMIALISEGSEEFGKFKTALENAKGAADKMAEVKMDNLNGAIESLKGSLESLAIQFFSGETENTISGGMKHFISDGLVPVTNAMTNLITETSGLGTAIGMVFSGWGQLISIILVPTINGWNELSTLMGGTLKGLGALLVDFGAGLLFAVDGMVDLVKGGFEAAFGAIKNMIIDVINYLGAHVTSAFNTLLGPIRGLLDKIGIEIGTFDWTPLTKTPAESFGNVWARAQGDFEMARISMNMGMTAFQYNFEKSVDAINTSMNGKTGLAKSTEKAVKDAATAAKNNSSGLANALEKPAEDAADALDKIPDAAKGAMKDSATGVLFSGGQMTTAFGLHVDVMKNKLGELPSAMDVALIDTKKVIDKADIGGGFYKNIQKGWNWYIRELPSWEVSAYDGMKGVANSMDRALSDGFASFITTGKVDFRDGLNAVGQAGAQALGDALSAAVMKNMIGPGVNALIEAFSGGFTSILSSAGSMLSSLGSQISSLISSAGSIGSTASSAVSGLSGAASAVTGVGAAVAVGYGVVKLIESLMGDSKTVDEQLASWQEKNAIETDADVVNYLKEYLDTGYLNQYGSYKDGTLQIGLLKQVFNALSDADQADLLDEGGDITRWAKSLQAGKWNSTGSGSPIITPKYHTGGLIPGEGWFLGLAGEGVLSRSAMDSIGIEGLNRLNQGAGIGNQNVFVIYAWDGDSVEETVRKKIIPQLREISEAGEVVIHENGVKHAVA